MRLNASHSGSLMRQVSNTAIFLPRQPESFRSELLWVEPDAHCLVGVCPRRTQGGHHFNSSSIHKFFEIETKKKLRNKDAKPVASDGNFETSSLKKVVGQMHSPVPGQREHNDSNRVGHRLSMLSAIEVLVAPQKASWVFFSSLESWQPCTDHYMQYATRPESYLLSTSWLPYTGLHERERERELENTMLVDKTDDTIGVADKWQRRCQGYYHFGVAGSSTCLYIVEGQISQSPEAVHIADHLKGGGCVKGRRNVQVFLIPTFGDRLESSVVVVFGSTDALHASGHTRKTEKPHGIEQPCS